jgi:hypothetical protein
MPPKPLSLKMRVSTSRTFVSARLRDESTVVRSTSPYHPIISTSQFQRAMASCTAPGTESPRSR